MLVPPLSSATSTAPWANLLPAGREALLQGLSRQLHQSLSAADENLGHLEEQLLRGGQELFRQMLAKAAQQKADSAPPLCPHCQNQLSRVTSGHGTTIQSRFGLLRLQRARGWCRHCHKFYGGTCFRLSQRAQSAGGWPTILSRGYAMTRGGVDALNEQLWAEAMRHGLGRSAQVLIVADGAAWIWHLAGDRLPGARQRVDFYHVSQHLWSVAHALHPDDAVTARAWVEPMLEKLKADESCAVITELEQLRERLDYGTAKKQGEPLGMSCSKQS